MKITVLGTRGEIEDSKPYHSHHSGVLINDTLLIDCGEKEFLSYNPKNILITHLHPDHAFFVRKKYPPLSQTMYAPEKYDEQPIQVKKRTFALDGYTITPIPTVHSIKVKSTAYLITHNNKKILYTGDMIWIEKKYHHLLHDLDLVITEASYMRKGGLVRHDATGAIYGHTGVPNLIALFKKYTDTILFVHFGSWFYKNIPAARKKFKQLARENSMHLVVGYDGLTITI